MKKYKIEFHTGDCTEYMKVYEWKGFWKGWQEFLEKQNFDARDLSKIIAQIHDNLEDCQVEFDFGGIWKLKELTASEKLNAKLHNIVNEYNKHE